MKRNSEGSVRKMANRGTSHRFCLWSILFVTLLATPLVAAPVSEMVVFGDSFSDTGNVYAVVGLPVSPPYDSGRFSNGPMWVELLAEHLGVPVPTPSLVNGVNYAWGGATTGSVDNAIGVPNIDVQVAQFLGILGGSSPSADTLFVLLGGANDHLNGQVDPTLAAKSLAAQVSTLASVGAQQVLVGNVFPHADGPYVIEPQWADSFSETLVSEVVGLQLAYEELSVGLVDLNSLVNQVKADPTAFGLANGVDPACQDCNIGDNPSPTTFVPNPDEYFFWDYVHPTRVGHALMAGAALPAVPGDRVPIDIKPGSDSNPINLKSKGVLPLAILSEVSFDAREVNLASLLFGDPLLIQQGAIGVGPVASQVADINSDGLPDLSLKFSVPALVNSGALSDLSWAASLRGETYDGEKFVGLDALRIVPGGQRGIPEPTTVSLMLLAFLAESWHRMRH